MQARRFLQSHRFLTESTRRLLKFLYEQVLLDRLDLGCVLDLDGLVLEVRGVASGLPVRSRRSHNRVVHSLLRLDPFVVGSLNGILLRTCAFAKHSLVVGVVVSQGRVFVALGLEV